MTTYYQPKQTDSLANAQKVNPPNGNSPISMIAGAISSLKSDIEKTPLWETPEIANKVLRLEKLVATVEQKFKPAWDAAIQGQFKTEREKLLAIIAEIHQSPDWNAKLKTAVTELYQTLQTDRVFIYRFDGESQGVVMEEAMESRLTPLSGQTLDSTCLGADRSADFLIESMVVIDDTSSGEFTPRQRQLWEKQQVKALLTVPLLIGKQVWGLLVLQQCSDTRHWLESEIHFVYNLATELNIHLQQSEYRWQLQSQPEQERIVNNVLNRIRQSQNLDTLFNATCREVRQLLNCDRVSVFSFIEETNYNEGVFIAADVRQGYATEVGNKFIDSRFGRDFAPLYRQGRIQAVSDIHNAGLSDCHAQQLAQFDIRANLIVPLMKGEELWGLLCIHHCGKTHKWQTYEIEFVKRIASQFGLALDQAHYLEQLRDKTEQLAIIAEREKVFLQTIGKVGQSIADKMQQSLDVETIFKFTTQQIRRSLKVDRVAIYRFNPDWSGTFVAESVSTGWTSAIKQDMSDNHFVDDINDYGGVLQRQGMKLRVTDGYLQPTRGGHRHERHHFVVDDIYQAGFPDCYLELLEQLEAKAYILVPIFAGDTLWGLLTAYQNSEPRHWDNAEVNLLTQISNQLGVTLLHSDSLKQLQTKTEKLAELAERQQTLTKVVDKMRQSLDVNAIFRTTTQEMRQLLECDRLSVYQFRPDWSGIFVAEAVGTGWDKWVGPDLETIWEDSYLQETQGGRYRQNQRFAIDDIHSRADDVTKAGLSSCHVAMLEYYKIKAYIIVPIFLGDTLWGLLAAYQHSDVRQWEDSEVNLLAQVGIQMGVALRQAKYLEQVHQQSEQLAQAAKREKEAKEQLQKQAIQLLSAIQPTLKGDLTVRLPITTDEVGTIADAYNNMIQAIRKILSQVKTATDKVTLTSQDSSAAIAQLSHQAQHQSREIASALQQVEVMANSTQAVAKNAALVEATVQQANQIVRQGDTAMNRTVDEIVAIRETVAKTGKKIKRLSESSQKISKAVNLIGNLATQTNLLALNAAIEATRAGEYGKGFAVVADEVRSLARQSAAATTEIEQLVQGIQAETSEVVGAMETGIQQVVEGTNLVNETRQNLNAIVTATAQIKELVEGITQATQKETRQTESVTETMQKVAAIANQTSEHSLQIAASFKELLGTAEELQTSVGKFKVS